MGGLSLEHPPHLLVQHAPTSQGPLQKMPPWAVIPETNPTS